MDNNSNTSKINWQKLENEDIEMITAAASYFTVSAGGWGGSGGWGVGASITGSFIIGKSNCQLI